MYLYLYVYMTYIYKCVYVNMYIEYMYRDIHIHICVSHICVKIDNGGTRTNANDKHHKNDNNPS